MQNQQESKFDRNLIMYMEILFRTLLIFAISGIIITPFLIYFLHIPLLWTFLIMFIVSVLITPYLSKITFGRKIAIWYIGKLKDAKEGKFIGK